MTREGERFEEEGKKREEAKVAEAFQPSCALKVFKDRHPGRTRHPPPPPPFPPYSPRASGVQPRGGDARG